MMTEFSGQLAGVSEWQYAREVALRGFVKCSDGRLYHPVICALAQQAFARTQQRRDAAKALWKHKKKLHADAEHPQSIRRDREREREREKKKDCCASKKDSLEGGEI